jgi:hypothetical protein
MSDEFDEILEPVAVPARSTERDNPARVGTPSSRLVARLFAAAGNPLRVRLLRCLMQPLGTLGAAGVAAGAFAAFLNRHGGADAQIDPEAVSRLSSQQVVELAHFVEQVDPQALQQFASLASGSSLAMATFSAAALVLLYRRLQPAATLRAVADSAPGVRPTA